jgi:hypothetical protein
MADLTSIFGDEAAKEKKKPGLFDEAEKPIPPRVFSDDDKPAAPRIFSDEEKPVAPELFKEAEKGRFCRYCKHYVVNPFVQRCARHGKEVEATDTCREFTP